MCQTGALEVGVTSFETVHCEDFLYQIDSVVWTGRHGDGGDGLSA